MFPQGEEEEAEEKKEEEEEEWCMCVCVEGRGGGYLHTNYSIVRWETSYVLLWNCSLRAWSDLTLADLPQMPRPLCQEWESPTLPAIQRVWFSLSVERWQLLFFFTLAMWRGKEKNNCHPQSSPVPRGTTSTAEKLSDIPLQPSSPLHPAFLWCSVWNYPKQTTDISLNLSTTSASIPV